MAKKKTWVEKRDCGKVPEIKILEKGFHSVPAGAKLLIPSPGEIDAFIRALPKGSQITTAAMREALAAKHGAAITCPLTTGIFLRIVCEAAIEEMAAGKSIRDVTPFWRVVGEASPTAKKLSIAPDELAHLRAQDR